jgi:hypothetical protein
MPEIDEDLAMFEEEAEEDPEELAAVAAAPAAAEREINDGDVHVESASCNTDPYATFRHIVVDEHDSVNKVADSDVHPDRQWSDFPEIETAPYSELLLRRILQRREVGVTPVANLASSAPLSSAAAPSPSPE